MVYCNVSIFKISTIGIICSFGTQDNICLYNIDPKLSRIYNLWIKGPAQLKFFTIIICLPIKFQTITDSNRSR